MFHLLLSPAPRLQAALKEAPAEKKLWGGRFTGLTDPLMDKFNESLPLDRRMWREDLKVSNSIASPLMKPPYVS